MKAPSGATGKILNHFRIEDPCESELCEGAAKENQANETFHRINTHYSKRGNMIKKNKKYATLIRKKWGFT